MVCLVLRCYPECHCDHYWTCLGKSVYVYVHICAHIRAPVYAHYWGSLATGSPSLVSVSNQPCIQVIAQFNEGSATVLGDLCPLSYLWGPWLSSELLGEHTCFPGTLKHWTVCVACVCVRRWSVDLRVADVRAAEMGPAGPSRYRADLSSFSFVVCWCLFLYFFLSGFGGLPGYRVRGPRLLATAFGAAQLLMCFPSQSRKVPLWPSALCHKALFVC